jgi:6-pyruvoyltetrahydropterin/6-carboxytetrahydropterin synthase
MEEEIYLTKETSFDAAHNLLHYDGACARLHGHTWTVRVKLGPFYEHELDNSGIAVDFKDIKAAITRYDHQYLNNYFDLPSAEHIALSIFKEFKKYRVVSVEVDESPSSTCRIERAK